MVGYLKKNTNDAAAFDDGVVHAAGYGDGPGGVAHADEHGVGGYVDGPRASEHDDGDDQ
jgi:hypothetical protein